MTFYFSNHEGFGIIDAPSYNYILKRYVCSQKMALLKK
jgi:hypothetical protein